MEGGSSTNPPAPPAVKRKRNSAIRKPVSYFKLLGLSSSYIDTIIGLVLQCTDYIDDVHLYVSLGSLTGAENQPIHLPVSTPSVIALSEECQFQEALLPDRYNVFIAESLLAAKANWRIRSDPPHAVAESQSEDKMHVTLDHLKTLRNRSLDPPEDMQLDSTLHDDSKCLDDIADGRKYFRVTPLGQVLVYIPGSAVHLKVACVARKELPAEALEEVGLVTCHYRSIRSWTFFPLENRPNDFTWKLFMTVSYEIPTPSDLISSAWIEEAIDEIPPMLGIRFEIDSLELRQQLYRYSLTRPDGIRPMIHELMCHARDLVKIFSGDNRVQKYYYPSYLGDIASQTRRHYNLKRIAIASQSRIETLRRLNNEAKRFLIQSFVPDNSAVLDLACGHGQDIGKYSSKSPKRFVGIDISSEEIREALNRMKEGPTKLPGCSWEFHVGNLLQDDGYKSIQGEKFDVVSIQLAIHYCMQTEASAEALFSHISEHLNDGGVLIGSTGCCSTIASRIGSHSFTAQNAGGRLKFAFGNDVYKVTFTQEMLEKAAGLPLLPIPDECTESPKPYTPTDDIEMLKLRLSSVWGISYFFHLIEHIDAEEFVVPWDSFCEVAARYGLEFVQHETFDGLIARGLLYSQELKEWTQRNLGKWRFDDQQMEAFSFYKAFVFSKGPIKHLPPWLQPKKTQAEKMSCSSMLPPLPILHAPTTSQIDQSNVNDQMEPQQEPLLTEVEIQNAESDAEVSVDSSDSISSSSSSSSTSLSSSNSSEAKEKS